LPAGTSPKLDASWGYDLQAGVDFEIAENLMVNLDVRFVDIESDLKLNGATLAQVEIDPILVGISLGWKF
jgi:outer membrane protein